MFRKMNSALLHCCCSTIYSIIGGVVVILGLYMLLWGKDKDQEYNANKQQESDLDCEKQARITEFSAAQNDQEEPRMKR